MTDEHETDQPEGDDQPVGEDRSPMAGDAPPDAAWMGWSQAAWRILAVVLYFVLATALLPDQVMALGFVVDAPRIVQELILTAVWGLALAAGLYGLRVAQRRRLI